MGQAKQRGTKEQRAKEAIKKHLEQRQKEQEELEIWKRNHPLTPQQLKARQVARQVLNSILSFACSSIRK